MKNLNLIPFIIIILLVNTISNGEDKLFINQVPFLVYIGIKGSYGKNFCTGFFIHKKWILTAASCFDKSRIIYEIKYGISNGLYDNYVNHNNEISKFILHTYYVTNDKPHYNIALIKLKIPIIESNLVKKINLNFNRWPRDEEMNALGRNCAFYSFTRSENQDITAHKSDISLVYEKSLICAKLNRYVFYKKNTENTTGIPCFDDAGGPLICDDKVVGLFSKIVNCNFNSTFKCTDPGSVAKFVYLNPLIGWIKQYVPLKLLNKKHIASGSVANCYSLILIMFTINIL